MKQLPVRIQNRYHSADEWFRINPVLAPGEIGIESDTQKVKYGDGETAWRELKYAAGGGTVSDNITAENVYFTENITVTKEVGYIELKNGKGEIPSKDKNLREVFEAIFVKEVKTGLQEKNPYISFGSADPIYVEIGTTVTPEYNISFGAGKYKYGPAATDVTMSNYNVTNDKDDETKNTASGKFSDYKFTDVNSYKVNATCTSSQGAIPFSNLGNEVADQRFAEATRTAPEKTLYTSYKPNFYGFRSTALSEAEMTSDNIRQLTSQGSDTNVKTYVKADSPWIQFIYAVPKDGKALTAAQQRTPPAPFTISPPCTTTIVHAEGITSEYNVFYITLDVAASAGTEIDLTWG